MATTVAASSGAHACPSEAYLVAPDSVLDTDSSGRNRTRLRRDVAENELDHPTCAHVGRCERQ